MLNHLLPLGTLYPTPATSPVIKPDDRCLLFFPNYVTGALMGVDCAATEREQVESWLKLAHAERYYQAPPAQFLSLDAAAAQLKLSRSTIWRWIAKGWLYSWRARNYECVVSQAEVHALRLASPRGLDWSPRPRRVSTPAPVKNPTPERGHRAVPVTPADHAAWHWDSSPGELPF
jgi:hypothetical protein